jgi:hypothetical protein
MDSRRGTSNREAGQALVFVTLVLALAMLVLPSFLNFMGGAGRAAQIREDRMLKVYAADAGIEEAYHRVLSGDYTVPGDFTIEDVNGYAVDVEITSDSGMYKAVATSTGYEGANASIESYFGSASYTDFLDSVISSEGEITIQPNTMVIGNLTSNVEPDIKGTHVGNVSTNVPSWPEPGELGEWYSDLLAEQGGGACDYEGLVNVDGNVTLVYGPCETSGDLEFKTGVGNGGNVSLNGVLYVAGDFVMNKNLGLYLNGNTIYVEGSITFATAGQQENAVQLHGPGCLIAEGDVIFNPKPATDESFIFVMSVSGEIHAKPMGNFWGSFAGNTEVFINPLYTLQWMPYPTDENNEADLDFPGGGVASARVVSYVIRQ